MKYLTVVLLLTCFCTYSLQDSNVIRRTKHGFIRGELARSTVDATVEYYSFKGVPYARPPVGKLRFQPPLPPKTWFGIRDATESQEGCVQISEHFLGTEVEGSEDCLYLEVYESKTATSSEHELKPVLVWIHGGTFIFGTANGNVPDYFMEKPVVVISVGYRLNVFSFLSTKDKHAMGNNGLKDQRLALKWVQENIANFGGDPNRVTIFGGSAGGASVQYHLLSEKSEGLFQRAISHSGSTFNRWALQEEPLQMTFKLAKGLGIHKTDNKALVKDLQKVDYKVLMKAAFNHSIVGFYTPYYAQPFAPSIESENEEAFISESTYSLMKKGRIHNKVPYMLGHTTEEGSFGYDYIRDGIVDINIYESNPGLLIPISMNVNKDSECYSKALEKIRNFYFKNGSVTDKANWITYMNQELFVRGITKTMDIVYKHTPTYFYKFSYVGDVSFSYLGGVGHYEDIKYLWKTREYVADWEISERDRLTTGKRYVTLLTNFAATGNPTPEKDELLQNVTWPKVNAKKQFLDIGDDLTVKELSDPDYEFWEKLFEECGNPPYFTY